MWLSSVGTGTALGTTNSDTKITESQETRNTTYQKINLDALRYLNIKLTLPLFEPCWHWHWDSESPVQNTACPKKIALIKTQNHVFWPIGQNPPTLH